MRDCFFNLFFFFLFLSKCLVVVMDVVEDVEGEEDVVDVVVGDVVEGDVVAARGGVVEVAALSLWG